MARYGVFIVTENHFQKLLTPQHHPRNLSKHLENAWDVGNTGRLCAGEAGSRARWRLLGRQETLRRETVPSRHLLTSKSTSRASPIRLQNGWIHLSDRTE